MKCESCGYNIPEGYEICPNCHKPIKNTNETQQFFGTLDNTSFKDDKLDIEQYIRNPKNKKKLPIIFGGIIMFVIVLIIVFGLMFVNKKDDKNYFVKYVDDFFEAIDEKFISNQNNSGHYKLIAELPGDDYKIEGDYEFDIKNKLANLSIYMEDPNKSDETIILESDDFKAGLYLENNNLYLTSKNLLDRPVLIKLDDKGSLTNKYNEKTIMYSIQSAIGTSIKSHSVSRKKEVISFHGEKLNVKSQTFTLDKSGYQDLISDIFDNLNEDYSLINELKRMTGLEKDDISKFISSLGNEFKYKRFTDDNIKCIVYYKKGKVYRIEIKFDSRVLTIDKVDDNYYIVLKDGETEQFNAQLNITEGTNDDGVTVNYDLAIEYDKKKYDFSFTFSNMKSKKLTKQKIENYILYTDIDEVTFERYKSNVKNYFNNLFDKHLNASRIDSRCYQYAECICDDNICNCTKDNQTFKCPVNLQTKEES